MKNPFLFIMLILIFAVSAFSQRISILTNDNGFMSGSEIMLLRDGEYYEGFPLLIEIETNDEFGILFSELKQIVADETENEQLKNQYHMIITDIYENSGNVFFPLEPGMDVFYVLDGETEIPIEDVYLITIEEDNSDWRPDNSGFNDWTKEEQDDFINFFESVLDIMDAYAKDLINAKSAKGVAAAMDIVYKSMLEMANQYSAYTKYIGLMDISSHPRGQELSERWENVLYESEDLEEKLERYANDPLVKEALENLENLEF